MGTGKYNREFRQISIADAGRPGTSWARSNSGEDILAAQTYDCQIQAAESALCRRVQGGELKTRLQRGPLSTSYPRFAAAKASVGLTAICEFNAHTGTNSKMLLEAVKQIPSGMVSKLDPNAFEQTRGFVVAAVRNRLCIDHLYRFQYIASTESYRLLASALFDRRFEQLKDLITAAVTMGDLVFGLVKRPSVRQTMHPLACKILAALAPPCERYTAATAGCAAEELLPHGLTFARELMTSLLPMLPLKQEKTDRRGGEEEPMEAAFALPNSELLRVPLREASNKLPKEALQQPLAGSDDVVPPAIDHPTPFPRKPDTNVDDPASHVEYAYSAVPVDSDERLKPAGSSSSLKLTDEILRQALKTLNQSTSLSRYDNPRVDQVEKALSEHMFSPGVLEGQLAGQIHKVTAYGSGREGAVNAEVLSRCRDDRKLRELQKGTEPICRTLLAYKWFGRRREVQQKRLQYKGKLDPGRFDRLGASQLLSRRWEKHERTDYRGRPVVVLAKDGSSSNTVKTTFAGQLVTGAFLSIEQIAKIQVFAADYCSDGRGTVVRWIANRYRIPGRNSAEAMGAVASLPKRGQGGNEDVLSISHIVHEVLSSPAAHRQTVIVLNVTDGRFNSPLEEYRGMVKKLRQDHRLIYSLIVLGDAPVETPEVDHFLRIPESELENAQHIAEKIGHHVNGIVRQLRGETKGRHE